MIIFVKDVFSLSSCTHHDMDLLQKKRSSSLRISGPKSFITIINLIIICIIVIMYLVFEFLRSEIL